MQLLLSFSFISLPPSHTTIALRFDSTMPMPRYPPSSPATSIDKRFPQEVWCSISIYLYPSQLSRLSMVSKALNDVISALPDWAVIFKKAHDDRTSLRLLPEIPASKSFMLYMCAMSSTLCEACLRTTDITSAKSSSFPLPVNPSTETIFLRDRTMVGCSVDDGWFILMCLNCRISYFGYHPESIPRSLYKQTVELRAAKTKYHMENSQLGIGHNATSYLFMESDVLQKARNVHGGDVGIKALSNDGHDRVSMFLERVHGYSRR